MKKIDIKIQYFSLSMNRKDIGLEYFRILWIRVAEKVIDKAIHIYQLDETQSEALKKAFLKPNHYYAISR